MARSRAIMHIIKAHNGKRLPKANKYDLPRFQFNSSIVASQVVWVISTETGRECMNINNIVTVFT